MILLWNLRNMWIVIVAVVAYIKGRFLNFFTFNTILSLALVDANFEKGRLEIVDKSSCSAVLAESLVNDLVSANFSCRPGQADF